MSQITDKQADEFFDHPEALPLLERESKLVDVGNIMPLPVNFWHTQNLYYYMLHHVYPTFRARAGQGDEVATSWVKSFLELGHKLKVRVPQFESPVEAVDEKAAQLQ